MYDLNEGRPLLGMDPEDAAQDKPEPEGELCPDCGKVHPPMPKNTAELVEFELSRFERRIREDETDAELQAVPLTGIFIANLRMDDPEALNYVATMAGLYVVKVRKEAADYESGRKEFLLSIQKEYEEQGMAKTPAEAKARADQRYIDFVQKGNELAYERDVAEVIYDSLRDRGRTLRRGPQMGAALLDLSELFGKHEEPAPAEN